MTRFGVRLLVLMCAALLFNGAMAVGEPSSLELRLSLRTRMLERINADRAAHGLQPVKLDPIVTVFADEYCEKQLADGTTGHFLTDGISPYMRYSFAGGNDGVVENAAAWSANYRFTDMAIPELAVRSQKTMMAEVPPFDGHRRAILDPNVTHVGLGFAWRDGEFRMVQEFVRRHINWIQVPERHAKTSDRVMLRGRPHEGLVAHAITVHHEPFPSAMSVTTANAIESYALPESRRDYLPRMEVVSGAVKVGNRVSDFHVSEDGTFSFAVPFPDGPGVYTIVTWLTRPGSDKPFPASNISVRVSALANGTRN